MGLAVKQLTLGEMGTNCYLAWDDETMEAIIIDPADEGGFITEQIQELELIPEVIVLTHGHFDHILGLLELKLNLEIPVIVHEADVFLLEKAQESARHWLKREVDPIPAPDQFLRGHDILSFGDIELKILETPGHTPGSVCLYNDEVIFTGDTLFADGVGRTDFKYSDRELLQKSIQKIRKLPKNLIMYPGHGEVTTLEHENAKRQLNEI
jgi:hydroxyacylglutathione hydrolase